MSNADPVGRREFLNQSLAVAGAAGLLPGAAAAAAPRPDADDAKKPRAAAAPEAAATIPRGSLGRAKVSRLLLGGNLIGGYMHCRDLKYVNSLFRAYATDEKIIETLALAERHGINTVFETGGDFVERYNRRYNGRMQFIPHIEIKTSWTRREQEDHIKQQVDAGAVALYVWGVSSDSLLRDGQFDLLARAVEMAKKHDLPVGVGCHSLLVPKECEKHGVPCDFYVKTFHGDDYPSATPKELRKEFIWLDGGKGWYDNMWCINPEETVAFMQSVAKPWIAFKILAAGAIPPAQAFPHAFRNGADFIAVGMFDFQVKADAELAERAIRHNQKRARPWRA
ncbi:hypothetical protein OJF2_34370 [Aquisphaera giovannonii]|uniref:Twin-arginine translocation signal domain-containing protein n=1 Tax=Aquisphaera giovannonii TaxID=406548 RepID=A0A5B9W2T2_9BACT|nr:hypothetical protein [Aquisphaera giovannonii]QEH34892.1 hypothetical protein OJF2_34370 [Aquisphaera giovannonii]